MERPFDYDEKLVVSCSASVLMADIIGRHNDPFRLADAHELIQFDNAQDQACWDLFAQHGQHFRREIPSSTSAEFQQQHLQQLLNDDNTRLLERFRKFLKSVQLVNEHNNRHLKDSSTTPSFRLTLNRFADVLDDELPLQSPWFPANRRLSLGLEAFEDQDLDDGAAWFHPWENAGKSDDSDSTPLTRLADWRDIRLAVDSSWGIGNGSINRLNVHVHHHHHHHHHNDMDDEEKPTDFAVPVDQSAFAQVPFPDDDVAVSKLNGKELAIKQAKPAHRKQPNATASDGDDDDDDDGVGGDVDDDNTAGLEREPFAYLNWATTENPDGVPLVHDVFDQGKCGSCWAFAATGTLETSVARRAAYLAFLDFVRNPSIEKDNQNVSQDAGGRIGPFPNDAVSVAQEVERAAFAQVNLSIQQLVDCDTAVDRGCTGGNPLLAFYYIHRFGLASWVDYPYVGYQDKCHARLARHPVATVKSWGILTPNHEDNIELVLRTIGPVAVGFNGADPTFLAYQKGIFDHPTCGQSANHALLIVGFGQEEQENGSLVKYWIARNSWGKGWGENGYVRVKRGDGAKGSRGVCGIARSPSVALGGTWLGGDNGFCSRVGFHLGGLCESLVEANKAFLFGFLAIFFTSIGIVLPLTADCRRRRRRRKARYQEPHRASVAQQRFETQSEAFPLLLNGSGERYGGSNA